MKIEMNVLQLFKKHFYIILKILFLSPRLTKLVTKF